jgi:hypothetical protein
MRKRFAVIIIVGVLGDVVAAQGGGDRSPVIGTWNLVAMDRATGTQPLAPVPNPLGILIQDARGNVIEITTRAGRPASLNSAEQIGTYQVFWGTFTVDRNRSTATYRVSGSLDPGRAGQSIVRSFERNGTRLIVTESAPDGAPVSRTTWERIPELEGLPDYQRDVVGFWQWMSAGLFNDSGTMVQPTSRDPSVILYTPTGHMAVLYLPPPGRKPFAGPAPTVEEARAAMQGAVSYFGTYFVQPKSKTVSHYQLGAQNPAAVGGSFTRNFEIDGAELTLRFPPTMLNGQRVRNVITLRRLSGLGDMWPDYSSGTARP